MQRRGILYLVLAVGLGLVAAWVASRSTPPASIAGEEVTTVSVVVARVDLPTATSLEEFALTTVEWPKRYVPDGALQSVKEASGRVARRPIASGEPVLESALFERGTRGGLGAVIDPAYRAVSVKVDSVIGLAGFVRPGSRVDVLTTLRRVDQDKAPPVSKVILQDVRVLAVDQQLEEARDGKPEPVNVVTLEVDPVQAEHLTYAAHEGRLQLALRTPGDDSLVATTGASVLDVLGMPAAPEPIRSTPNRVATRNGTTVQVLRGVAMETKNF